MKRRAEFVPLDLDGGIRKIQEKLWDQLMQSPSLAKRKKEVSLVEQRIRTAFRQKVSTSVIVVGPTGSGKKSLVASALKYYERLEVSMGSKAGGIIARVHGRQSNHDGQALLSIVNQFMCRDRSEKNPNLVLEDLERILKHRRLEGMPAIIVIDDIDEYAKKGLKQTLIYTLLDLMHKEDMLFVLIGLTHCFNLEKMLEKRVVSRLNAQFVFVKPPSAADICEVLSFQLQVGGNFDIEEGAGAGAGAGAEAGAGAGAGAEAGTPPLKSAAVSLDLPQSTDATASQDSSDDMAAVVTDLSSPVVVDSLEIESYDPCSDRTFGHVYSWPMHVRRFNERIVELFGTSWDRDRKEQIRGSLFPTVQCLVDWGWGLRNFSLVALSAIARLSPSEPFLSYSSVVDSFESQCPLTTRALLSSLTHVELHLIASCVRLHHKQHGEITAEEVKKEFDQITGLLRRKELFSRDVYASLANLCERGMLWLSNGTWSAEPLPAHQICDRTAVHVVTPVQAMQDAFRLRSDNCSAIPGSSRGQISLVVSERVRRAVLEPLVPIQGI